MDENKSSSTCTNSDDYTDNDVTNNINSSIDSENSTNDTNTNTNINTNTKIIQNSFKTKKQKIHWRYLYIIIICFIIFNLFFLFINILIIYLCLKNKIKTNTNIHEKYKYQLLLFNQNDKVEVNEIIEMDQETFWFDGMFYPIPVDNSISENGSGKRGGMLLKINSEGDEYKMCAEECECYMECENDKDCGNGMNCVEYQCIDENGNRKRSMKNRKETKVERKGIPIVMTVPLFICIYGVFTTMILAQEYAVDYFKAECKKSCHRSADEVKSSRIITETLDDKYGDQMYYCVGYCKYASERVFLEKIRPVWNEIVQSYVKGFTFEIDGKTIEVPKEILISYIYHENDLLVRETCATYKMEVTVIATSIELAEEAFYCSAALKCDAVKYEWIDQGFESQIKSFKKKAWKNRICEPEPKTFKCERTESPVFTFWD